MASYATHKLKTVGDLLEMAKRLPLDMGLREYYIESDQGSDEMSDFLEAQVTDLDGELVLEFKSQSLKAEIFGTKELDWNS